MQSLVSVNTRRNEATSGQQIAALQQTGENLTAVRTQCRGVDLRAGATCSHLLESNRTRECYEVVCMGNKQGMSITWNVFNRLGRGADIRETLNRIRQHSIAQRV